MKLKPSRVTLPAQNPHRFHSRLVEGEEQQIQMETMTETSAKSKKSRGTQTEESPTVTFAVQCNKCLKWRTLATQEELEEFRCNQTQDPFVCHKLPDTTCRHPPDITYDSSRVWAMDKPDIPKTPKGFHRSLTLRRDLSRLDVKYVTPHGTRIRTGSEMTLYLQQHPQCTNLLPSDFSFVCPKLMRDTLPKQLLTLDTNNNNNNNKKKSK